MQQQQDTKDEAVRYLNTCRTAHTRRQLVHGYFGSYANIVY